MTVTHSPRAQVLLERYLSSGSSAEQVLERALETPAEKEPAPQEPRKKTPVEAVAGIRELRKGLTLSGLKVQDLIRENRKY